MKKEMVAVSAICAAIGAFAADICTFETGNDGWTDGTPTAAAAPTQPANGYAITDAAHTQVLAIEGTATKTLTTSSSAIQSADFLVKVVAADEDPAVNDVSDARFALAFDEKCNLVGYMGSGNTFTTLCGPYTADSWIRITVVVATTEKKAWVAVDGKLLDSTGYTLTGDTTGALTQLKIIGTSQIDDVVVKDESSTAYDMYAAVVTDGTASTVASNTEDASGNAVAVPLNYLTINGKAAANVNDTIANSQLTYAQAYQAGVAPAEGAKFEISGAAQEDGSVVLTFPGNWDAATYKVKYGTTPDAITTVVANATPVKDRDVNKVTLALPDSGVLFYAVTR